MFRHEFGNSFCSICHDLFITMAAVVGTGVSSLSLEGERKNQLVVVGAGVDPVRLVKALRKKVGYARMMNFAPVTEGDGVEGKTPAGNNASTGETQPETPAPITCVCQNNWPPYVYPVIWEDPCSIL